MTRFVTVTGAMLGWAALALQFVLTVGLVRSQGGTALDAVWRYLGYFTVIANIFAAAVLTLAALGARAPRREFAAATAMILVGVTYSLLLRETWNPQGLQKIADIALHDAMPVTIFLFWMLRPHGELGWRAVGAAMALPLAYLVYAMVRGAATGWYAYPFIDLGQLGAARLALNCACLTLAFMVMASVLLLLDRAMAKTGQPRPT